MASRSCKIAITGRNVDNLNKCKQICLNVSNGSLKDDSILVVPGDVEQTSDCKSIVEKTVQHFGQLDILINSAGIISMGTVENTSLEDYDR